MTNLGRGLLWVFKGVLVVIALAALLLWPWSYRRGGTVRVTRYTTAPAQVDRFEHSVNCFRGLIVVISVREVRAPTKEGKYWEETTDLYRFATYAATSAGPGRKWELRSWKPGEDWEWLPVELSGPSSVGWGSWARLHWKFHDVSAPGYADNGRLLAGRCWMVAVLAGAWPAVSFGRLVRRARRRRRARAGGFCASCGYDLRATPERCPECGSAAL
jgi:hypothetical protein